MQPGVLSSVPARRSHEHALWRPTARLPRVRQTLRQEDQHGRPPARPHRREALLLLRLRGQLRPAGLPAAPPAPTRLRETPPVLRVRQRIHPAAPSRAARAHAHGRAALLLLAVPQTLRIQERTHRPPENTLGPEPEVLLLLREGLLHAVVVQGSCEAPHGTEAPPLLAVRQELQPAGSAEETPAET